MTAYVATYNPLQYDKLTELVVSLWLQMIAPCFSAITLIGSGIVFRAYIASPESSRLPPTTRSHKLIARGLI